MKVYYILWPDPCSATLTAALAALLAHKRLHLTSSTSRTVLFSAPRTASPAGAFSAVVATVIGNSLEWFDFSTYAFFAVVIGREFFPASSSVLSLMDTFAAFGMGLLARPLGAIFFGRLGDRRGRRYALLISIPLMGLGTVMMGAIPAYRSIGMTAPLLLILGRLVQGFSAGGEVGSAMAFLSEWAPPNRRALYSSLQQFSTVLGTMLGSGCAALITTHLPGTDLSRWGWRVPFIAGGLIVAPVGLILLSKVQETPIFANAPAIPATAQATRRPWAAGAQAVALSTAWVVCFYIYLIYLPSFLTRYAGLSAATALSANTAGLAAMVISIPLSGALSDRLGRRPPLLAAALASLAIAYPVFDLLVHHPPTPLVYAIFIGTGILSGIFAGVVPATMSELFPTLLRTTGVSVSFGISTAIFGGFSPFIATGLISLTKSSVSPAYYLIAASLLSTATILCLRETAHTTLE